MEDKRTTNFFIWKGERWVKAKGIISESLLCLRPGCRKKPRSPAKYQGKKHCCTDCRIKHNKLLGKGRKKFPDGYEMSRDDITPNFPYSTFDGI